jgi:hypothetical protein
MVPLGSHRIIAPMKQTNRPASGKQTPMPKPSRFMLIAVFALVVVGIGSSSTAARHARSKYTPPPPPDLYCLQGRVWGYPGNCQFANYEQCMATASGTFAYCGINPVWAFRGWRQQ